MKVKSYHRIVRLVLPSNKRWLWDRKILPRRRKDLKFLEEKVNKKILKIM